MFWSYLRSKLKWVIIGAVHDSVAELEGDEHDDAGVLLATFKGRLTAQPAAAGEQLVVPNGRKRDKAPAQ